MKKIWIIHNSLHGNSEKISKQIAEGLKDSYDVSLDSIKTVSYTHLTLPTIYSV